jgi:hypothetical protein
MLSSSEALRCDMRAHAAKFMGYFERNNSFLSADELADIARSVSPGGAHTGGFMIRILQRNLWHVDPLLVTATIYANWHGGKVGFQFLDSPRDADPDAYEEEATSLIDYLGGATDWNPRRVLTGDDLSFYDALPDAFTVYRGCAGVSPDMVALGVCWTTNRAVADWFAGRSNGERVVMTARAKKHEVVLVNASEAEVVLQPRKPRQIAARAGAGAFPCV